MNIYKIFVFIFILFSVFTFQSTILKAQNRTFYKPEHEGYRLDWCLSWASQCGEPAATKWCSLRGYTKAVDWVIESDIGDIQPTKVLSSGEICDQSFCDGFRKIVCRISGKRIYCPVEKVRTEVTTTLPSPWWDTPQVGNLQEVDISTIGGEETLICRYSAYGKTVSVMRKLPSGITNCEVKDRSFLCY